VRALLIVNPRATSAKGRDVARVTDELSSGFDLKTAETRYPSHARELAAEAVADGFDLIIPLGGDGTLNETVNGLMHASVRSQPEGQFGVEAGGTRSAAATDVRPDRLPVVAPIPGGGANVFAQSFGFPPDLVESARLITRSAKDLANGQASRTIGLGLAGDRYFTFSASLGLDAEVLADVNRMRAKGRRATPGLYLWTATRHFYFSTDRRTPALTVHTDVPGPVEPVFMGVVTNSAPWTYLGHRPVTPVPKPDFNSGLDMFALRRLRTTTTLGLVHRMLHIRDKPPEGRDVVTLDGLSELTIRSRRPIAFQADGEYLGEVTEMPFRYVPNALRVLVPRPPT